MNDISWIPSPATPGLPLSLTHLAVQSRVRAASLQRRVAILLRDPRCCGCGCMELYGVASMLRRYVLLFRLIDRWWSYSMPH